MNKIILKSYCSEAFSKSNASVFITRKEFICGMAVKIAELYKNCVNLLMNLFHMRQSIQVHF